MDFAWQRTALVSLAAAALALMPAVGALAATNPAALNPTPDRPSQLLVDSEGTTDVTGDPNGTGDNLTSVNTDPQFVVKGTKLVKLDFSSLAGGWHGR